MYSWTYNSSLIVFQWARLDLFSWSLMFQWMLLPHSVTQWMCCFITCHMTRQVAVICHFFSAFHPSGVGKWVPASAGKAKAGMVHSVSGWTRGVQVKLWDPLRTCAIPERLRGAFTTRRYTNPRLPLPYLTSVNTFYVAPLSWSLPSSITPVLFSLITCCH